MPEESTSTTTVVTSTESDKNDKPQTTTREVDTKNGEVTKDETTHS